MKNAKELMKALKEKNAVVTPTFYLLPGFEMENVIFLVESPKEDPRFSIAFWKFLNNLDPRFFIMKKTSEVAPNWT